jgi:hypothetical protein
VYTEQERAPLLRKSNEPFYAKRVKSDQNEAKNKAFFEKGLHEAEQRASGQEDATRGTEVWKVPEVETDDSESHFGKLRYR